MVSTQQNRNVTDARQTDRHRTAALMQVSWARNFKPSMSDKMIEALRQAEKVLSVVEREWAILCRRLCGKCGRNDLLIIETKSLDVAESDDQQSNTELVDEVIGTNGKRQLSDHKWFTSQLGAVDCITR